MENKELTTNYSHDFSPEQLKSLSDYKKNGCPGLVKTNETEAFQWFELYMSGKTYVEISKETNSKLDLILYFSEKGRWHEKRMTYYSELNDKILHKCMASRLEAVDTMSTMISALNKYYSGKFNKFLKNKDNDVIERLDTKMLSQYHKVIESVEKIMTPKKDGDSSPNISIHLDSSRKTVDVVEEGGENSEFEDVDVAEALKNLAKLSRSRKKNKEN